MLKKLIGGGGAIIGGAIGSIVPGVGTALGASIGGAIGGAVAGSEAEGASRKAAKAQKRMARLQSIRQRKELIRNVQFQQAAALNANLAAGMGLGSSMLQGQQASQRTTLKDDLGMHAVGGNLSDAIYARTRDADRWNTLAGYSQAIGQIGSAIGSVWPNTGGDIEPGFSKSGPTTRGGARRPKGD
jgi:hypothetical protein